MMKVEEISEPSQGNSQIEALPPPAYEPHTIIEATGAESGSRPTIKTATKKTTTKTMSPFQFFAKKILEVVMPHRMPKKLKRKRIGRKHLNKRANSSALAMRQTHSSDSSDSSDSSVDDHNYVQLSRRERKLTRRQNRKSRKIEKRQARTEKRTRRRVRRMDREDQKRLISSSSTMSTAIDTLNLPAPSETAKSSAGVTLPSRTVPVDSKQSSA